MSGLFDFTCVCMNALAPATVLAMHWSRWKLNRQLESMWLSLRDEFVEQGIPPENESFQTVEQRLQELRKW